MTLYDTLCFKGSRVKASGPSASQQWRNIQNDCISSSAIGVGLNFYCCSLWVLHLQEICLRCNFIKIYWFYCTYAFKAMRFRCSSFNNCTRALQAMCLKCTAAAGKVWALLRICWVFNWICPARCSLPQVVSFKLHLVDLALLRLLVGWYLWQR